MLLSDANEILKRVKISFNSEVIDMPNIDMRGCVMWLTVQSKGEAFTKLCFLILHISQRLNSITMSGVSFNYMPSISEETIIPSYIPNGSLLDFDAMNVPLVHMVREEQRSCTPLLMVTSFLRTLTTMKLILHVEVEVTLNMMLVRSQHRLLVQRLCNLLYSCFSIAVSSPPRGYHDAFRWEEMKSVTCKMHLKAFLQCQDATLRRGGMQSFDLDFGEDVLPATEPGEVFMLEMSTWVLELIL